MKPFLRFLSRLPILVYRAGLGWVFCGRAVLLTHTGRSSGIPRQTVLEVIGRDADSTVFVAMGFGPRCDWARNLRACPRAQVQIGNCAWPVEAHFLETAQCVPVYLRYGKLHPMAFRYICHWLGGGWPTSLEDGACRLAGRIPVVALTRAIANAAAPKGEWSQ